MISLGSYCKWCLISAAKEWRLVQNILMGFLWKVFAELRLHLFLVGLKEFIDTEITESITDIPLNAVNQYII